MAKPAKKYSDLSKEEIKFVKKILNISKVQDIDVAILKRLKEALKQLSDIRQSGKIIYKLWDVVMCVILASFADCNDWDEIHIFVVDNYKWLKNFLQMTGGIPTAVPYERIMSLIDSDELNNILISFFTTVAKSLNPEVELLNFDGRVNNGSKRNATILNDKRKPLNCLNVYSNKYGYCIETVPIDEKTNEIPTIETLINGMDLHGVIVTWDALNTQTSNVKAVLNAGGDYIVPIKGNQGNFYKDLVLYFDDTKCDEIIAGNSQSLYKTETEKSYSSIIKYEYFQTSDIDWYPDLSNWEGVKSFGMVRKTITKKTMVENKRKNAKKKRIEKIVTTVEKSTIFLVNKLI